MVLVSRADDGTDRVADSWGMRTPHRRGTGWPGRVGLQLGTGMAGADVDPWVQSACGLCSHGCGCEIAVEDGRMVGVRGRATGSETARRLAWLNTQVTSAAPQALLVS